MKKGTKGAVIAAVTCIAAGCILMGAGAAAGGGEQLKNGNFRYIHLDGKEAVLDDAIEEVFTGGLTHLENKAQSGFGGRYDGEKEEKGSEVLSGDFEREISYSGALKKLEAKAGVHMLEIREGSGQEIRLSGKNCDRVQCYVKDGELCIQDVGKNKKYTRVNDRKLVLTVPEGICWEEAEIEAAVGGVEMKSLEAEEAELDAGMGSIEIRSLIVKKLDAEADMGSVEVSDAQVGELDVEANMGSIDFSGRVDGDIDAKVNMGSIVLTLEQDITDFDYEISSDMGSVTLDGEEYSGLKAKWREDNGSGRRLTADSSMGSIDICFE